MNKYLVLSLVITLCLPAIAKRSAPKELSLIKYHNLEIIVPHFVPCLDPAFLTNQKITKFELRPIYLAAKDTMTNVIIWVKLVYFIKYDNKLEQDIQDVFINKISLVNDDIYIENEANEKFKMNMLTGKIKIISKNKNAKTIVPENLIEN